MTTKVTGMMQTSTKGGDISSASPTVIDTDGDYFDVTGTTNFAAFTVAAGRRFTVQFDGVLTMTHHATNLDLPGGANITTAAGDVAEFFATGTNTVQCVNYTKADGTAVVSAGGGAWTLIGTTVMSGASSATQTGLDSTYDTYAICLSDIVPSAAANIYFRVGDSGGIDSGASDYDILLMANKVSAYTPAGTATAGAAQIQLTQFSAGEAAGEGFGAVFYLSRPGDGAMFPTIHGTGFGINAVPDPFLQIVGGIRNSVITLDRVQILPSTGTFSGRFTVYGISHS